MALINITLPAMGEGIIEATINKWLVSEGSVVSEDDPLAEVATDKVDSEVNATSSGKIVQILAKEGTIVKVGDIIAVIENQEEIETGDPEKVEKEISRVRETTETIRTEKRNEELMSKEMKSRTPSGKFISPLVRSIAAREGISYSDLDKISGSGMDGRITKEDIIRLIEQSKKAPDKPEGKNKVLLAGQEADQVDVSLKKPSGEDERIEMDRVRKIISDHMIFSKKTSAHVTSFIDADVTRVVNWRNTIKDKFLADEGMKLTLTPIFIDAAARALHDFPMINVSVEGTSIIIKKNINIGMATALPDGNLIVPVIKNADEKSLTGLVKKVNDLAERARINKLKPEEITGGTFTITNFGTFNNIAGTPIINQPQTAILGTGAVRKVPAVIETADGDVIAIRQVMILSLSFDHRVIDGALAGKFLNRIKEILENYSPDSL